MVNKSSYNAKFSGMLPVEENNLPKPDNDSDSVCKTDCENADQLNCNPNDIAKGIELNENSYSSDSDSYFSNKASSGNEDISGYSDNDDEEQRGTETNVKEDVAKHVSSIDAEDNGNNAHFSLNLRKPSHELSAVEADHANSNSDETDSSDYESSSGGEHNATSTNCSVADESRVFDLKKNDLSTCNVDDTEKDMVTGNEANNSKHDCDLSQSEQATTLAFTKQKNCNQDRSDGNNGGSTNNTSNAENNKQISSPMSKSSVKITMADIDETSKASEVSESKLINTILNDETTINSNNLTSYQENNRTSSDLDKLSFNSEKLVSNNSSQKQDEDADQSDGSNSESSARQVEANKVLPAMTAASETTYADQSVVSAKTGKSSDSLLTADCSNDILSKNMCNDDSLMLRKQNSDMYRLSNLISNEGCSSNNEVYLNLNSPTADSLNVSCTESNLATIINCELESVKPESLITEDDVDNNLNDKELSAIDASMLSFKYTSNKKKKSNFSMKFVSNILKKKGGNLFSSSRKSTKNVEDTAVVSSITSNMQSCDAVSSSTHDNVNSYDFEYETTTSECYSADRVVSGGTTEVSKHVDGTNGNDLSADNKSLIKNEHDSAVGETSSKSSNPTKLKNKYNKLLSSKLLEKTIGLFNKSK